MKKTLRDVAAGREEGPNKAIGDKNIDLSSSSAANEENILLPAPTDNPNQTVYMPIAFDADEDLTSFDPFAPSKVPVPPPRHKNTANRSHQSNVTNPVHGLTEFDDLPTEEVVVQPQFDPKRSLRRSREVVVKKDSNKMAGSPPSDSKLMVKDENGRVSPAFDIVDGSEVDSTPYPASGARFSQIMKARENVVKLRMAAKETEFTEKFPFTIFVGTWNVNGQVAGECLKPWLSVDSTPPDIITVGFQELDLSAEALVFNDSSREESWLKALEKALPANAEYSRLRTVRLVGMMLTVFIQTKHMQHVVELASETCGTGIMGKMGNKGGVSVRFQLHNSTICFVNSHLAAHLAEYERRNQDFKEVSSRLQFSRFEPPMMITHHDVVIWLGDLNYRLDDLDVDRIKGLIDGYKLEELYKFDQLRKQRLAGKVFQGYTEGKLCFKPTYKFDPGTNEWDTSEKGRAPAWCDRILWRSKALEQIAYRSHPALMLSDHKPVSALFSAGVKIVNRSRERQVFEEIMLELDRVENDHLPQVKLGKTEFHFNEVQFMEDKVDILPVANIGQVPVEFQFIPKLDDKEIAQPWLKLQPRSGVIMPGDVKEIEITVSIDKEIAPTLHNHWKLEEILVLHLIDGKDFFSQVPINGNFVPSVFGASLSSLVRMYGPISMIPVEKLINLDTSPALDTPGVGAEPLEIPKELWLLVDHLYRNGMREENILIQSGLDSEIVRIRNYLDTGQKGTMQALQEPVVPYKFQSKCMDACTNFFLCKQVISQIPDCHINVFRYITSFLREVLKYVSDNKLSAKMLATVFGSILLRPPIDQTMSRRTEAQMTQKKARFVYHFLVNDFSE
eukprot:gene376-1009_t